MALPQQLPRSSPAFLPHQPPRDGSSPRHTGNWTATNDTTILRACYKNKPSVESQKGAINIQRYSVENQKGAIAIDIVHLSWYSDNALLVLNGTSLNIDNALLALN